MRHYLLLYCYMDLASLAVPRTLREHTTTQSSRWLFLRFLLGEFDQIIRPDFDWNPQCSDLRVLGTCREYGTRTNSDFSAATLTLENPE